MSPIESFPQDPPQQENEGDLNIEQENILVPTHLGEDGVWETSEIPNPAFKTSPESAEPTAPSAHETLQNEEIPPSTESLFDRLSEKTKGIVSHLYEGSLAQEYVNRVTEVPTLAVDRIRIAHSSLLENFYADKVDKLEESVGLLGKDMAEIEANRGRQKAEFELFVSKHGENADVLRDFKKSDESNVEKLDALRDKKEKYEAHLEAQKVKKSEYENIRTEQENSVIERINEHLQPHEERMGEFQNEITRLDAEIVTNEQEKEKLSARLEDIQNDLSHAELTAVREQLGIFAKETANEIKTYEKEIALRKKELGRFEEKWKKIDGRAGYWRDARGDVENYKLKDGREEKVEEASSSGHFFGGEEIVLPERRWEVDGETFRKMQEIDDHVRMRGDVVPEFLFEDIKGVLKKINVPPEMLKTITKEKGMEIVRSTLKKMHDHEQNEL